MVPTNYNTYGVNGTMWGGNGNGGGERNGDGSVLKTTFVKNIIPQNINSADRGFIAIQEDQSGNQSCVGWGGNSGPKSYQDTPDSDSRSFRHIVQYLNSHSPYQIGLDVNGITIDHVWSWLRSNRANLHEYDEENKI